MTNPHSFICYERDDYENKQSQGSKVAHFRKETQNGKAGTGPHPEPYVSSRPISFPMPVERSQGTGYIAPGRRQLRNMVGHGSRYLGAGEKW